MAINKGKCIEYKGKALDDIQLSDTAETDNSGDDDERLRNEDNNQIETQLIVSEVLDSNKVNMEIFLLLFNKIIILEPDKKRKNVKTQ